MFAHRLPGNSVAHETLAIQIKSVFPLRFAVGLRSYDIFTLDIVQLEIHWCEKYGHEDMTGRLPSSWNPGTPDYAFCFVL